MTTLLQPSQDIIYPESDGKPMSENTEHYRWIVTIKENLEILYAADANVFIAGDLLWFPVKGRDLSVGPDVMVIFGAPKGKRGRYLQWEEGNIAPQAVFEIRSPSNSNTELKQKFDFYQQHGVQEYYLYDPHRFSLDGWQRQGEQLAPILQMDGWVSPLLKIRFLLTTEDLEIYRPDGRKFLSSVELETERQRAESRAERAESRAERAESRAERAESRAEQAKSQLEQLSAQLNTLSPEQLRALGIDPELLG